MDIDPLADTAPPRYAVESDDEDEFNPQSSKLVAYQPPDVNVEFISDVEIPPRNSLVFASGEAGAAWARSAKLGEQRAGFFVDKLQVGLLFLPSWTKAVVVVSEATPHAQLPLNAINTYTTAVIDHLQPASVALLDSYPTQGYISSSVISREDAPIRYLSVGNILQISDPGLELFAPPNLLQSTTASVLLGLFLRSLSAKSAEGDTEALLLLPSHKTPLTVPSTSGHLSTTTSQYEPPWDSETLKKVHQWLFQVVGENEQSGFVGWDAKATKPAVRSRSTAGEVGEGGMDYASCLRVSGMSYTGTN
ncbi:hypothetical protein F5I97DRAFT_1477972 [Phlebopus sp. FC_14]|nr:hypothetical protein F5I97DRAFT_1477972 [Phlebopus sp. FC_14]